MHSLKKFKSSKHAVLWPHDKAMRCCVMGDYVKRITPRLIKFKKSCNCTYPISVEVVSVKIK